MIKYKAEMYYTPKIKKIEIERETDFFVWVDGRRENKDSECCKFFDTLDDAKNFIVHTMQGKINYYKNEIISFGAMKRDIERLTDEDC